MIKPSVGVSPIVSVIVVKVIRGPTGTGSSSSGLATSSSRPPHNLAKVADTSATIVSRSSSFMTSDRPFTSYALGVKGQPRNEIDRRLDLPHQC